MLDGYFHLMNTNGAAHVYREEGASTNRVSAEVMAGRCELAPCPVKLMLHVLRALRLFRTMMTPGNRYR